MKTRIILLALTFAFTPLFWANAQTLEIYGHKEDKSSVASNPIPVEPQKWYTFSDQYKSGVTSEIDLYYTLSNGSVYNIRFEQFPESKKWQNTQINFATPPGAVSLVIKHSIRTPGHLLAKDFSLLEKTD